MKYIGLLIILMVSTNVSAAGTINCGMATIKNLYVQGDRGDGNFHANKMLIVLGDDKLEACNDFTFAYLENTDEAYSGTLSMTMAAYMSGKKIRVQIEDSAAINSAKRIAWVNF